MRSMKILAAADAASLNSILLYNGVADGVTDNSAALLAAWAANPNYPNVFFPPGKYAFAGNVTYPAHLPRPVSLMGSGQTPRSSPGRRAASLPSTAPALPVASPPRT